MTTYTQIVYHIVYSTKGRNPCLTADNRKKLFRFMSGVLKKKNCFLYCINGVEDHIHILTHIHPTLAPSELIKNLKLASAYFIRQEKLFPHFDGWQIGFGAFTVSFDSVGSICAYIKNQEEHHKTQDFESEYRCLLEENKIAYDDRYLF